MFQMSLGVLYYVFVCTLPSSLSPPSPLTVCQGLLEMLPVEYLSPFNSQELEWVIAGTAKVDMTDWKNNTVYWGGVSVYEYHYKTTIILDDFIHRNNNGL